MACGGGVVRGFGGVVMVSPITPSTLNWQTDRLVLLVLRGTLLLRTRSIIPIHASSVCGVIHHSTTEAIGADAAHSRSDGVCS